MISQTLRQRIRDILSTASYDQAILFGSQVRNDATAHSDVDILVILRDDVSLREKIRLSTELRKRLASELIDADILVKDHRDIEALRGQPGSVVRNALNEGVPL